MNKSLEYREFSAQELRMVDGEDQTKKLSGYAAVFNKLSENLGFFREKIAPGAFTKTIKTADVRLLINHDGLPLARTKSGTLKLDEDQTGLHFEAAVDPNDPDVQRIIPKLQRKDLTQMSFGFYTVAQEWKEPKDKNEDTIRTLLEVELFDISLVTFPAYPQTGVSIRSAKDVYDSYLATMQTHDKAIEIERLQAQEARHLNLRRYF